MQVSDETTVQLQNIFSNLKDEVEQLLILLSERERFVIERRFALDKSEKATLEEIGQHYNVTRERIRQIENNALNKLKRNINNSVLSDINDSALVYINQHGGIIREDTILSYLLKDKSGFSISAFLFILSLDKRFVRKTNTISFIPHFKMESYSDKLIDSICSESLKILKGRKDIIKIEDLRANLIEIDNGFEAKGWINIRSPIPVVIYIFIYLLQLLKMGHSEEIDRILEEIEDNERDTIPISETFLFIPNNSTIVFLSQKTSPEDFNVP